MKQSLSIPSTLVTTNLLSVCGFTYSGCLIQIESYNMCPFYLVFFTQHNGSFQKLLICLFIHSFTYLYKRSGNRLRCRNRDLSATGFLCKLPATTRGRQSARHSILTPCKNDRNPSTRRSRTAFQVHPQSTGSETQRILTDTPLWNTAVLNDTLTHYNAHSQKNVFKVHPSCCICQCFIFL